MIAKLKGRVELIDEVSLVLDVQGVGYLVQASSRTLSRLSLGEAVGLHIETLVREDAITLFGFLDVVEKAWFRLLQSVQGVGAKVALAILAILPPESLATALVSQDHAALCRANGVGPKLGKRIASELKDKAASLPVNSAGQQGLAEQGNQPTSTGAPGMSDRQTKIPKGGKDLSAIQIQEATSALENLGYGRSEAFAAVAKAQQNFEETPDLSRLISAALKVMST